jgi:hypothetical protein
MRTTYHSLRSDIWQATSSILLVSLLLTVAAPFAEAAPTRVPTQKGMVEYCLLIKLALKKAETVKPSAENQSKFALSIDMLTKANALCDAMLGTQSVATTSVDQPQRQQGLLGYCFLIETALKKGGSVVPSEQNQSKFALSIDMLTKANALCDAMLAPTEPPQKGLVGYCLIIDFALKASESVVPSAENETRFDATVDLLKKASALCGAMQSKEDQK